MAGSILTAETAPEMDLASENELPDRRQCLERRISLVLCIALALLVTITVVQYSYLHGRLAEAPNYDDISYFNDAAQRVQSFYDNGVAGLVAGYKRQPPHSPFETALGMIAYTVFGFHDWAPYVVNGLLALTLYLCVNYLLFDLKLWKKILLLVFLTSIRITSMAVHEFRPDFAVALFTVFGSLLLLTGPFVYGPRRRQYAAGAFFGLALLTKPPVFPQTIALACGTIVLATMVEWIIRWERIPVKAISRAWLHVLIPFVLIPLPHYAYDHRHIYDYIYGVFFGGFAGGYATHATLREHLLWYMSGEGGRAMLGKSAWLVFAMMAFGALALLAVGKWRDRVTTIAVLIFVAAAYASATVNPVKTNYFGLGYQVALVLAAIYLFGRLVASEIEHRHQLFHVATLVMCLFVIVGLWRFDWPTRHGNRYAGWEEQRRQIVQGVYDTIVAHTKFDMYVQPLEGLQVPDNEKVLAKEPTIVFCGTGDVSPSLIEYMGVKHQVKLHCEFDQNSMNPEDFIRSFGHADFIFCAQSGTGLIADFIQSSPFQDQLYEAARSRSDFEQVGQWTFMLHPGHSLFLFMRREFGGFTPGKNMGPIEGPFPEYENHTVRWGYGPSSFIHVVAGDDPNYEIRWLARSDFRGEVVTIKVDGAPVATQPVVGSYTEMQDSVIPVELTPGPHEIEFAYSKWHTDAPRPMAVLFEHLQVAPHPRIKK